MKKKAIILICLSIFSFYACKQEQIVNIKIMSYNIRHGEGMDTILDLSRSAKIIESQAPDLCGLQEVDNFCLRSDSIGQTGYFAQKMLMKGIRSLTSILPNFENLLTFAKKVEDEKISSPRKNIWLC